MFEKFYFSSDMIIIEAYFDNRSFYRLGVVNIFREEKKLSSFLHHFPISTHTGKLDRHDEALDSFRTWGGTLYKMPTSDKSS